MKKNKLKSQLFLGQKGLVEKSGIFSFCLRKSGQKGVIILFTAIMLGILVSISLGLNAMFVPKIRLITEVKNSVGALFAAESGLEWCLYNNQIAPPVTPLPPVMANGATYLVTPADCSVFPLKAVGSFRNVNRALEINF